LVVRHGERLDEKDHQEWRKYVRQFPDRMHDPPLTEGGWAQAETAGKSIDRLLCSYELRSSDADKPLIYSSPTSRTISTAAGVAKALGCEGITPAYALNCCAAAQRRGVAHQSVVCDPTMEDVLCKGVRLNCWPPIGDSVALDRSHGFVRVVKELVSQEPHRAIQILVTHREGIWELQRHVELRPGAKYCSVVSLEYNHIDGTIDCWNMQKTVNREKTTPNPRRPPPTLKHTARTVTVKIAEGSSMALWRTPGVHGVWVEGSEVSQGEVVELHSSPQAAEDGAQYVLVREKCGNFEGWLPLDNVCLLGSSKGSGSASRSITPTTRPRVASKSPCRPAKSTQIRTRV